MDSNPRLIFLFSGKRKSGKDYVTDILLERIGHDSAVILKISAPIKSYWAKTLELSLDELLSAGSLKEQHRQQMIEWSEKIRNSDHGVFCREAIQMYNAKKKPIWIVSDIRRKTDISWFQAQYPSKVITVRVTASDDTRTKRGWIFTSGIDDAATECDLDDVNAWDFIVNNDCEPNLLENFFEAVTKLVNNTMK